MSCIISYKGKKYSEEQFKEYFINNKQEFATSIAKNKDIIDSFKRKMEGIDFVYSQSPELASIGSKAQYLQYLSTIFKTSKVKDIVYHGTKGYNKITGEELPKFEKFDKSFIGKGQGLRSDDMAKGFYFGSYKIADRVGTRIIPAILNVQEENNTTVRRATEDFDTKGDVFVVFEPEQIHILGSKQDIKGFKEFLKTPRKPEKSQNTLKEVVDQLSNTTTVFEIDELLSSFAGTDVSIVFDDSLTKLAYYKDGVIYINPVMLKNNTKNIVEKELAGNPVTLFNGSEGNIDQIVMKLVVAHELVHALTVTRIKDYMFGGANLTNEEFQIIDDLHKTYTKVKPKLQDDSIDFYEFVSKALTSPAFATKIQQILHEEKSLLSHIWEMISRLFGQVSPSASEQVRKLLELNFDTNKETLHSFGEEFNFTGATPNMDLLLSHQKGELSKVRKRMGILRAQTNQIRHDINLTAQEKTNKIAEIGIETTRLKEKEDRFRILIKNLESINGFQNFQDIYSESFYKADVDEVLHVSFPFVIQALQEANTSISRGQKIEVEKLMRALEELDAISFTVEKWKAYASVNTDTEMRNHLFTPYSTLKQMYEDELANIKMGTGKSELQNKYRKFFLSEDFSGNDLFSGSSVPYKYRLEDSMPSIELRYLKLRLDIINLLVNRSSALQTSGVFSPTPFAQEIFTAGTVTAEGNVTTPTKDITFFDSLFSAPAKNVGSQDNILATVIKMKMDEVDNLAISDFNKLTGELNGLYSVAKREAEALGTTITKLFTQEVILKGIKYLTGNLIERHSDIWNKKYRQNSIQHSEKLSEINRDFSTGVLDAKKYEAAYQAETRRQNKWVLANMEVINPGKIAEVHNYIKLPDLIATYGATVANEIYRALMQNAEAPDAAYETYLKDTYGQNHYEEIVKEQKEQLDIYVSTMASVRKNLYSGISPHELERFLREQRFTTNASGSFLITNADEAFEVYALTNSPFMAHGSYYGTVNHSYTYTTSSGSSITTELYKLRYSRLSEGKKFITKIPRKYEGSPVFSNNTWKVTDRLNNGNKVETPYYDASFRVIDDNPGIKQYYEKFKEVLITANSWQPLHRTKRLRQTSLPLMEMGLTDILLSGDKNVSGWKYFLTSRLRAGFRRLVNDVFNSFFTPGEEVEEIERSIKPRKRGLFSNVKNKSLSFERLYTLKLNEFYRSPAASARGVDLEEEEMRIQYEAADEITREHNMDMHKLVLFYTKFMTLYSHKENAMPFMQAMEEIYNDIKTPEGNTRQNAVERMKYTYALWKFQPKHAIEGRFGKQRIAPEDKELAKRLDDAILVAIAAKDEDQVNLLTEWRDSLNKRLSVSKMVDELLIKPRRYLNIAGAALNIVMNRFQGINGNDILVASGNKNYPSLESLESARFLMYSSLIKFWTGGLATTSHAKRISNILKKLDALEDMTDEVEKAGGHNWWEKFNFSNLLWLGQRATEFLNQGEIIIASVIEKRIQHPTRPTESRSLYDLLDETGEISAQAIADGYSFSWDDVSGVLTSGKAKALRNSTQGDYTLLGTSRVKQGWVGRSATLFMTWVPEYMFMEYAVKQTTPHLGEFIGTSRGLTTGQITARQTLKFAKAWANPFSIVLPWAASAVGLTALAPALGAVSVGIPLSLLLLETAGLRTILKIYGGANNDSNGILKGFLGDYAYMMKAIAQRTLYRSLLFKPVKDIVDTAVEKATGTGVKERLAKQFETLFPDPDKKAEREAMRRAAEQGAIMTSFMLAQALVLLALFDEDDKDQKDQPLLNFLMWLFDKVTNDISWQYSFFSKIAKEGENVYSSLGEDPFSTLGNTFSLFNTVGEKSQQYDYVNRDDHAYKPTGNENSLGDIFKKSITPNAILQARAAIDAYKYSYGQERPFNAVSGSASERYMQKQARQEHGVFENEEIKMKKKLEAIEKKLKNL